jgi:predicted phage terminase large subunit-like protein
MTQQDDDLVKNDEVNLVKHCFKSFLVKSFQTLNPTVNFQDNWHIDLISEYLKEVAASKIKRLIINIPPRSLKSTIVSVAWPAWLLGKDPTKKIIVVSYSQSLSNKHSQDCRALILSDWYKRIFLNTKIMKGGNVKNKFITTKYGFRFATSVMGTLTGEGADIVIVDDPHTPIQANSNKERNKVLNWFDQTLVSRLNDKKNGAIVLVMQRLHESDLSGHLLKKRLWKQLSIPIHSEKLIKYKIGRKEFVFQKDKALNALRDSDDDLKNIKLELGAVAYSAQYMQHPISSSDQLIKKSWIHRYPNLPEGEYDVIQSWDCAIKVQSSHDYSVCTTWGVFDNKYYLLDVLRERLEYWQLKNIFISQQKRYSACGVLVEDKASGQSLIQEMRRECEFSIIPILPKGNKTDRFISCTLLFEGGKIFFPENAVWLNDFEMEMLSFPSSDHDDQVDSMTQFLNWVKSRYKSQIKIRKV